MNRELTDDEWKTIQALRRGESVLVNVNFGFGVVVSEGEDGRARISVSEQCIHPGYDGPALRRFMSGVVASWTRQLRNRCETLH